MVNNYNLNLTVLTKELKLLLFLMKMENDEEVLLNNKRLFEDIDWGQFLQLARHHRVHPIVYTALKGADKSWIPSSVVEALRMDYQKSTFQMLHLSGEMEQLSKLFTEHKIQSMVLKGPILSQDLYGDVSLRTSRDLDILIPIDDLDNAEALLLKLGYDKLVEFSTILNDWRWRHHHITFIHPVKGVTVEIHWRLNPGPAKEPSFHELWERRRLSPLTSFPVYFLGKEDLFFYLASHGARHGWSRLRWLADMDRIAKQKLDWGKINCLMQQYKCLHVGGQTIILASQLLNTPIITEMKPLLAASNSMRLAQDAIFYLKEMINLHTIPVPQHVSDYHKRHLFSLMSFQNKILFVMSFFYPYPEDAQTLPLPKAFHFLYFPLRPILWAWRKTRKYALP
ncbi:nucleotidyltransferase family protein [Paenibacillus radicis (ex Xue et al. 2023)]|uniref:Nucleotidyltransferase family protein n=1 Tax=Paenibacillus radicis (ex Xue et al. 2023) TaxID=2972489 RepID=A0ABT1YSW6_9BACL|nr:nucleotidyltransferase family protein [Paenibacillus radicis (ex Xue et al. 2023)]MCR8635383.1 nucleotidyltransferase family protein [Paenibacillus radicis (ex Xue et al. 2023)]